MTCLYPDNRSIAIHPLEVLDQPAAGHALDLAQRFRHCFGWRFDGESLHGLLLMALRHFPRLKIAAGASKDHPSCESLIRRLQLAGDLAQTGQGLVLTPQGEGRLRSTFLAVLAAPEWHQALERIAEDLAIFAETEGMPLAMA